jgi:exonuclease SbcC
MKNLHATINNIHDIQKEISKNSSKREGLEKQISENKPLALKIESVLPLLHQYEEKNNHLIQSRLDLQQLDIKKVFQEEKSFPNDGKFKDPLSYMRALRDGLIQFNNAEKQIENEKNRKKKAEDGFEKIGKKKKSIEQNMSDLEEQLNNLCKRLLSLNDIDDVLGEAEKHYEIARDNIENANISISAKKEGVRHLQEEIQRTDGEIFEAEKHREKYEKFNNLHYWLNDFFIPTLDQVEKQVLRSIQYNFNNIYQNWFSVLIDDPTKRSGINEDFSPVVEQDGYEQDVEYLSGGEKTSIALAYRLTLNSMIRQETESLKSNLLILDEPTDGFSKNQLSKVKHVLQQLNSQQIIIVSHEKELETYVDNICYISKDSGVSHVYRRSN